MEQDKKKRLYSVLALILLVVGVLILLYPFITAVYYDYQASNEVDDFEAHVKTINEMEIDERIEKARAYNASLTTDEVLKDAYSDDEKEAGKALYAQMLEVKEKIGYVEVPKIHQNLPLYAGTSDVVLYKGVGHLERTSLPVGGESTHAVVTGHSGLPDKKLFTDLEKMEIDDVFYVHNIKETLAYQVKSIEVISPHDFNSIKIEEGKDKFTLLTCTPYMINTHRLIVTGERIPYTLELEKDREATLSPWWVKFMSVYRNYLIGILITILLYLGYRWYRRKSNKQNHI